MKFTLSELSAAVGGELVAPGTGPAAGIDSVGIDSRTLAPGSLFVAVVAERDGHEFVGAAARRGAAAVLVSRPVHIDDQDASNGPVAQVMVPDTVAGLMDLGRAARARLAGPVVGITGSVGKTSTKDLLAEICRRAGATAASEKSLNNELGVPLTLANAPDDTQRAVIEMGARGPGHIALLCEIARPTIAVVTRVAEAHTEMFGSLDGVARAKGELVESLGRDGTAVLNHEDERVVAMADRSAAAVVTFGEGGDVRAAGVELDGLLRARFVLDSPWGTAPVQLAVSGHHHVSNALAAAAAGLVSGVGLDDVVAGLGAAGLSPSRMSVITVASGGTVIDDAYNANPTSMAAALRALAALGAQRSVAVVGLMAELGELSDQRHREIAELAAGLGVELVTVGTDLYGPVTFAGVDDLLAAMPAPVAGEAVLLKASRIVELDRVARAWSHEDPR